MNKRVLIVEDNAQNLYLSRVILEHHGFQVTAAENGKQALAYLENGAADLILLDIQLPDMDGYTVAQELRKRPRLNGVPIVALSSFAMPGDREKALNSGCDGYIEKPIDPETFAAQMKKFISPEKPPS